MAFLSASKVVGLLPRPVASTLRTGRDSLLAWREFHLDAVRFLRDCAPADSGSSGKLRGRHLECQLTKDYHRVEKGLALQAPKPGFGKDVLKRLSSLLPVALSNSDAPYVENASTALKALEAWHSSSAIDELVSPSRFKEDREFYDSVRLNSFFGSRRSVRNFDPSRTVSMDVLREAVDLARTTPSVCNRQSWQVHIYSHDAARQILSHQNGNRGFTETVSTVAVVTVDRRLFAGHNERNQRWIDGGLFAMNFVMALHGLGVDTCMLNWSMPNASSDALRKSGGIPASNDVIMLIAIGYAPEKYRVARSPRRSIDEVLEIHD